MNKTGGAVRVPKNTRVYLRQRLHDSVQQRSHPCGHLQEFQHCGGVERRGGEGVHRGSSVTAGPVCCAIAAQQAATHSRNLFLETGKHL